MLDSYFNLIYKSNLILQALTRFNTIFFSFGSGLLFGATLYSNLSV